MEKSLVHILQSELNIEEEAAKTLEYGLYDALGYQEQMKGMYCGAIPIGTYKAEITRARNALKKLNDALKNIGAENRETLDTLYYAANNRDSLMMQIPENGTQLRPNSGFETIALKMLKTMEFALKEVRSPGTGGARREGKEYIAGIEILRCRFLEACPNNEISPSPASKFYKYVEIWFSQIVKIEKQDIRRHIANTLSQPHIKKSF